MINCTSCGAENAEGVRFCVRCGSTLPAIPQPGSWQQPSGGLGSTPSGGLNNPSGGLGGTPSYTPPPAPFNVGYGGAVMSTGIGGMPYAVWADRVLAAIIDGLIVTGGVIVLYILITIISLVLGGIGMAIGGAIGGEQGAGSGSILGSGFCCIAFVLFPLASLGIGLYNKVFLVSKRGFSIGQGLMKLKVVTAQGMLVPTGTLVLRLLVQVGFGIIPFLPLLSILWPLWDEQRQALHDKAVGTFVVKAG